MVNSRQILGKKGEQFASQALKRKGYKIIARNYRCRLGEIDIIALDRSFIVFVEVKTRTSSRFGSGASAITIKKQQQIARVAHHFLAEKQFTYMDARFDVVALKCRNNGDFEFDHITNAFDLSDSY